MTASPSVTQWWGQVAQLFRWERWFRGDDSSSSGGPLTRHSPLRATRCALAERPGADASFKETTTVSDKGRQRIISLGTMRAWKSSLEQLGAAGDLELLRLVAEQRQRHEAGDPTNALTPAQISLIEGLTGVKAEDDAPE